MITLLLWMTILCGHLRKLLTSVMLIFSISGIRYVLQIEADLSIFSAKVVLKDIRYGADVHSLLLSGKSTRINSLNIARFVVLCFMNF